jgi:antitoxin component HigA of HigAB toxin-antitoxin module
MNLIGKNKIADYLIKHPEAAASLITWIKEFPYRQERYARLSQEPSLGCSGGMACPDSGEYAIKFVTNHAVNATLITWVGSKEEFIVPNHSSEEKVAKVVEVVVAPPAPLQQNEKETINHGVISRATVIHPESDHYQAGKQSISAIAEYEQSLDRFIALFDAQPGTSDFEELMNLIPFLKKYEANHLNFPVLNLADIVKLRMDLFQLSPSDVAAAAGAEAQMIDFLAGKTDLPEVSLAKISKFCALDFPLSDTHYLR